MPDLGADELVVGSMKEQIINHAAARVPITAAHQREHQGLAHALEWCEAPVDEAVMRLLEATVCEATLPAVGRRLLEDWRWGGAALEAVPWAAVSLAWGGCTDLRRGDHFARVYSDPPRDGDGRPIGLGGDVAARGSKRIVLDEGRSGNRGTRRC